MKKLFGSLLLAGVLFVPGCTFMKNVGNYVCDREHEVSAAVTQLGAAGATFVGPLSTGTAWIVTFALESFCKAFHVALSLPDDVATDLQKINPFGSDEAAKPETK